MKKLLLICFVQMLFITPLVYSQQLTITGIVTSATDGTTIPGVNIRIKGTTTGTTTDIMGQYQLNVKSQSDVLVFSYIGFNTFETIVGTQTLINVELSENLQQLQEVVVIGYGETTKKKFTGSLTSVGGEELEEIPQQSAVNMMQGRSAGVLVTESDGQPGSSASILIRGLGSFRGSSPLYVIDGIPAANFNSFNPSDIESITVLKDAAATSIYGSRAAAGVVLITTKKGASGKTQFNFTSQVGVSDIENPNDFRLMNGDEYRLYYREAATNAGINPDDPNSGSLYLPISGYNANTDWFDAVTRNGVTQKYEFSAKGGSDNTTFYMSLGYFDETGIVLGTDFERITGRLNLRHQASEKVSFEFKMFGSVNKENFRQNDGGGRSGNLSGSYNVSPLSPIYADENTPFIYNGLGYNFDLPSNAGHNPVAVADMNENYFKEYRAMPSLKVNYTPITNLKLWASAAYDFGYVTSKTSLSKYYLAETEGGMTTQSWEQSFSSNYNAVAEYYIDINTDQNVKVLAGVEAYKSLYENSEAGSQTFGFDAINNFAAGQATSVGQLGYNYGGHTLLSVFSRVDYVYKDKLFVHGSFRRDGSSVFGPGNRWGNFYAIGAGYTLSEEEFIKEIPMISNLKIKASYGIAGNPNSGDFEWRNTYSTGGAYNLPGAPNAGTVINNPGNSFLKWEQSSQTNIGVDFGLFNNRITGAIEYYDIRSIDLISDRPISATSGYTEIVDNIAEIKNNGVEITLNSDNFVGQDFKWSTNLNLSFNNNKVVSLTNDADQIILSSTQIHIKGESAYQWYMPTYAGVDPATGRALYYTEDGGTTFNYSDAVIEVQGKNPSIAPDLYGGLTNILSYKNFSLSALVYFRYGGKIYRGLNQDLSMSGGAGGANQLVTELNRWQQAGDITDVPKLDANNNDPGPSSRWLEDASYIRLRNISLSYSLPKILVKKWGFEGLTFSLTGVNLKTYTAYNGLSVTTGSTESSGDYPTPRTITFGLNAKF